MVRIQDVRKCGEEICMRRNILCIILCMILLSACSSKSNEIIEGYSNCEEYYSDGFQDYIDYCKYFYKESEDKKFEENSYYSIVTKENIDDIKSYFDKFPYESMEDSNKYDFETDNINEGDYYSLRAGSNNDNYSVFLYDVNSHILYYTNYNK